MDGSDPQRAVRPGGDPLQAAHAWRRELGQLTRRGQAADPSVAFGHVLDEPDVAVGPDRDLVWHAAAIAVREVEFGELAARRHAADPEVLGKPDRAVRPGDDAARLLAVRQRVLGQLRAVRADLGDKWIQLRARGGEPEVPVRATRDAARIAR